MRSDDVVRKELLALLEGGNAHMTLKEVVADFPFEHINTKPPGSPYSFWHFVEHIRLAQWDILEFIRNASHVSAKYPEGYRPLPAERTDEKGWWKSLNGIHADSHALQEIVRNSKFDLFAPIPHAIGYTIFRELLLVADHTAYHIGELAILRQTMGIWPAGARYLTGSPD